MNSSEVEENVSGPSWGGQTIGITEGTRLQLQLPFFPPDSTATATTTAAAVL